MKKTGNSYQFLYILSLLSIIFLCAGPLSAQVNQSELGNLGPVEFINYEGPYSRIETRAQIRAIGYGLGESIKAGAARAGSAGRYFVIHSVSAPDGSKLDADIFGLGADAGVDHIRNLRLIIQGYLEAAYEYTERDAALLAEYITIYNAVYRGDMDFFGTRYKNPVMENLSQEKAGLAIRYDEWPGQTLMLIPLGTGLGGPLSSIDTSAVSDSRVTEQLRQEPDMALDERKDMVDLKEREADEASQQAVISREAIRQEEERIAREREAARQREEQIAREQEAARQREEEARRQQQEQAQTPEQQAQAQQDEQAARESQEELDRQQQEVEQRQQELDEEEAQLEAQRQEAEQQEVFADQKNAEAQDERQQIAEDQQSVISQEAPPVPAQGVLGVSIVVPATSLGRLVMLDDSGTVIKQSPLNTVNARTVTQIDGRIFAVAGLAQGSGAIRLVEINPSTLEMVKQGDTDIAPQSLLWTSGQDMYAVTVTNGVFNMARFNTEMAVQARSVITLHPFASVFLNDGFLATQRENGEAVLLDPRDLSEKQ